MSEGCANGRRVALVTRAWAPYHRALQEAFAAEAKREGGELGLFYPQDAWCPFDQEAMRPAGTNITVALVNAGDLSSRWFQIGRRWKAEAIGTRLPSRAQWLALERFRPTEVWIHEFSPFCLGGLLYARRNGLPVIVSSEVGVENVDWFPVSVRLWHRWWGRFVDGWIAQTPAARRPVCQTEAPVVEAYHAADSRKLKPRSHEGRQRGRTLFVQVGRVLPRKGADLLLAALAWVKSQGRLDWELKLLGPDSDGWGAAQVGHYGLEGQVSITGHLDGDSLWEAFGEADVFTLATRQDTYAAVVHEAACLGLPLIVSRHAGAGQALVRDDVNGWVVDPEDSESYGRRLMRMLDGPTRERMSVESRRTGETFSAHERGPAVWRWMSEHFGLS
jgi:glycosyltransferase involved in cell wall biosynthesis